MDAPVHAGGRLAGERSRDQLPVGTRRGRGEIRNLAIGDRDRALHGGRELPQARAQDDPDLGLHPQAGQKLVARLFDCFELALGLTHHHAHVRSVSSRRASSAASIPSSSTHLSREDAPALSRTAPPGSPSFSRRSRITARFAFPPSGAAETRTWSAPSSRMPTISSARLFGVTRSLSLTALRRAPFQGARSWPPPRWRSRNRPTSPSRDRRRREEAPRGSPQAPGTPVALPTIRREGGRSS